MIKLVKPMLSGRQKYTRYIQARLRSAHLRNDLELLIANRVNLGICSVDDLNTYYQQFYVIVFYLKAKKRISDNDAAQSFAKVFSPDLELRVLNRLQIFQPNMTPRISMI